MYKKTLLTAIALCLYGLSFAQFEIHSELRPRMEFRNGYKELRTENTKSFGLVSQRSRIGFQFSKNFYKAHISFQDVRIWGEEQIKTIQLATGLHEAWVEFKLGKSFAIKTGRQALKYDNQRLVALSNWNQIGAKHDAIKVLVKTKNFESEILGAYNQSTNANFDVPYDLFNKQYQSLGILWAKKQFKNFSVATLNLWEGLRQDAVSTITHQRHTVGGIVSFKQKKLLLTGRGFFQGGKKQDGTAVKACYFNTDIDYKFTDAKTTTAGFEYLSGNKTPDVYEKKDKSFDVLYGSLHKFNGLIDYFGKPDKRKGMGLIDIYMKTMLPLQKNVSLMLDYHYFAVPSAFNYENVDYKSYLGSEIDLSMEWEIAEEARLNTLLAYMLPSKSMEIIKKSNPQEIKNGIYFMTMLTFKPVFMR